MIQLHYFPSNASMIPHILLEELGISFELLLVDRSQNQHKSADYLKLNPNGKIPTLVQTSPGQPDLVLYESAAICLHLSDTHPEAALAPALGSHARAHCYKWLLWLSNTFQPDIMMYFYPERYVASSDAQVVREVSRQAEARIVGHLAQLDGELARVTQALKDQVAQRGKESDASGPWMLGEQFSILDPYLFTLCRWTRNFTTHPARSYPHLGPYLQRMLARPSVQRVLAIEQLAPPFV
jgi:glutathione S-transferase